MKKIKLFILVICSIVGMNQLHAQWLRIPGAAPQTIYPGAAGIPSNDWVGLPTLAASCRLDLSNNNAGGGGGNFDISIGDYLKAGSVLVGPAGYRIRLWTVLHNTGTRNLFSGDSTGYRITSGLNNTASGYSAASFLTTGSDNAFFGKYAGFNIRAANGNSFVGSDAGRSDSIGSYNTYIGFQSAYLDKVDSQNVFVGYQSGYSNLAASSNTFIGFKSGYSNINGTTNTFSGFKSGYSNTLGIGNSFFGNESGLNVSTGSYNTYLGSNAGFVSTNDSNNVYVGYKAGYTSSGSKSNTYVGFNSGFNNSTGHENCFSGFKSGFNNTTGSWNTFLGTQAGYSNTTDSENVFVGYQSGYSTHGSNHNTYLGFQTGYNNTTGSGNSLSGYQAGYRNNANGNSFYGFQAGYNNTSGDSNSFFGYNAGYNNTTGDSNVFVGRHAGYYNETGGRNVCLGFGADLASTNLVNATAIGTDAIVNENNTMRFGTCDVVRWGFGVNASIGHAIEVGCDSNNGNGAFLSAGGAWTNGSDVNIKNNIRSLNSDEILNNINKLTITSWMYRGTNETHIGPMSQQFYQLFKTGIAGDDKHISSIDPAGIALIGIQELSKQNAELSKQNIELKKQVEQQGQEMLSLKNKIDCMNPCTPGTKINTVAGIQLMQNNPNPFSVSTTINYIVPEGINQANLNIYNMNGVLVKTYNIATRGAGNVIITGGELKAGSYVYSLIADGVSSESRIMVLIAN